MAVKKTKTGETKAKVKVSPTVKKATKAEAVKSNELVAEASIDFSIEPKPAEKKPEPKKAPVELSSEVVVVNTSQNAILLSGQEENERILIEPREIKKVNRYLLRSLMKNKIVRYWFDKGVLTSNMDANETSANEAKAPEHLTAPVERHDGANISASVTKFQKEGNVTINL